MGFARKFKKKAIFMDGFASEIEAVSAACQWDWYQTTLKGFNESLLNQVEYDIITSFDLVDIMPTTPRNNYYSGSKVVRGDSELFSYYYGGNNNTINFKSTGFNSIEFSKFISKYNHYPTRLDARLDWAEEGLFDYMERVLRKFAKIKKLTTELAGDWYDETKESGRTVYMGSKTSELRLVLYEKGKQKKFPKGHPLHNWVRLEVRFKPSDQLTRQLSCNFKPYDIFNIGFVREYLKAVGLDVLSRVKIRSASSSSDSASREVFFRQYGRFMKRWADELGCWGRLAEHLKERCNHYDE